MAGNSERLLIKNVRIFDGLSDRVSDGHVLIEGATIAAVERSPIAETDTTTVIDGGGRTLMPGMSDAHVHLVGMANTLLDLAMGSQSLLAASTLAKAKDTLLRGFTTVRDMAGDTAGIKKVIDSAPALGPASTPARPRSRRPAATATSASSTNGPPRWAATSRAPSRSGSCGSPTAPTGCWPRCASNSNSVPVRSS